MPIFKLCGARCRGILGNAESHGIVPISEFPNPRNQPQTLQICRVTTEHTIQDVLLAYARTSKAR